MSVELECKEGSQDTGVRSHRWFVGPVDQYDRSAAMQFSLLTLLGLREHHSLLDIGCGSLRAGRLFIPYLLPGYYCGLEPEQWLVENGLETELGREIVRLKQPTFRHDDNFTLTTFGRTFDFLIAQSVFSHATMAQIRRCLSQAREVMTPTSLFAATFRRGDSDYTGSDWVYPGCSTYRLETFAGMAEENGLGCRALTWPHSNGQTWVALGRPKALSRLPAALCDPAVTTGVAELFAPVFGESGSLPWETRLSMARAELLEAVPPGATFVLVDEDQWGLGAELSGRRRFQFPEQDGYYGGPPLDDRAALEELERLRARGATHLVVGWPAYWWLHHYLGLHDALRTNHRCVLENERLIVFELQG